MENLLKLIDKLKKIEERYNELEQLLATQRIIVDTSRYSQLAKEFSDIREKVILFREYQGIEKEIKELEVVLSERHDQEFIDLARKELDGLRQRYSLSGKKLQELMSRQDKNLDKDIIMEIRAGTGGLEASLFAADLYRMYTKYATRKNWQIELISSHPTELNGFKEVIFGIKGKDAYNRLRFESGVHRVQRVPSTEASGRIHTSTATVAVLEEPAEVDFAIDPKDIKVDVYRSSGPGGQGVNTTDSAVRLTHLPTGIVITCQDERSQLKNKNKAMRVLRARLLENKRNEEFKKLSLTRKSQVGSGERSEKIRTYNFPNRRVTDHRIGLTLHRLESILEGSLDEIVEALLKPEEP